MLLYVPDITRFLRSRFPLVLPPCQVHEESAGKRYGTSGTKIGNAHLCGLLEAAVLFLRGNPTGQKYLTKLEKKHVGRAKPLTLLGQKLGRTVYYMLQRQTAFDMVTSTAKGAERMSRTPNWTTTGSACVSCSAMHVSLRH